jgi:general secretion pathway protein C
MRQTPWPSAAPSIVLPLVTAGIWALAAAGAAYWVLQFPKQSDAQAATVLAPSTAPQDLNAQTARALGQTGAPAAAATVQASSQFKLLGVVARGSGGGSALIAIDGQAPKAYRVGQTVHDSWVLSALSARQARLQSSNQTMQLDLPTDEKANAKP